MRYEKLVYDTVNLSLDAARKNVRLTAAALLLLMLHLPLCYKIMWIWQQELQDKPEKVALHPPTAIITANLHTNVSSNLLKPIKSFQSDERSICQ
jgi:hypothetical protein